MSSTAEPSEPEDPFVGTAFCSQVSAETLSELAGRDLGVTGGDGATGRTTCNSTTEATESLSVEWHSSETTRTLQDVQEVVATGREVRPVTLPGEIPAALAEGEVAGVPVSTVVLIRDGHQVVVEARIFATAQDPTDLTSEDLTRIATEVASIYAVGPPD